MFLGSQTDVNEVAFLLRPAQVVNPREFSAMESAGDDVFLCEYEYDTAFRMFRRASERDASERDADWDWDAADEDGCAEPRGPWPPSHVLVPKWGAEGALRWR